MSNPAGIRVYLSSALEAEKESLREHESIIRYVDELDGCFRKLISGKSYSEHPVCGFLGMNAHAAYLSALASALRGQSPTTFMILRGCIESALYAFLVSLEKDDGDVWLRRDDDRAAVKAKFNANRAIQKLEPRDHNLAVMLKDTYQWMIELGAHPNPRSIVNHIRKKDSTHPDGTEFSLIYIHSGDSTEVIRCISACIENGCMAAALIRHAIPEHPAGDSVFKEIWRVFREFQQHLVELDYLKQSDIEVAY